MSGQLLTSFISFSWILVMCLITTAKGQVRVIGASRPIMAQVGDTVLLPCRCEPVVDLMPLTVEWSWVQLRTDPSDHIKRKIVHTADPHKNRDVKISNVMKRTKLFPDQFRVGNASLLVHNLTPFDSGTYRCFIPNLKTTERLRSARVTLIVRPSEEAHHPKWKQPDLDNILDLATIILYIIITLGLLFTTYYMYKSDKQRTSQPVRQAAREEQLLALQSMEDIELVLLIEPEPRPVEGTLQASDAI